MCQRASLQRYKYVGPISMTILDARVRSDTLHTTEFHATDVGWLDQHDDEYTTSNH